MILIHDDYGDVDGGRRGKKGKVGENLGMRRYVAVSGCVLVVLLTIKLGVPVKMSSSVLLSPVKWSFWFSARVYCKRER